MCQFPFTYHGVEYNECTDVGTGGTDVYDYTWCATAVDGTGAFVVGSGAYMQRMNLLAAMNSQPGGGH